MNTPHNLAEAASDNRVRTLVVDDSPFMLKTLALILEEAGNFALVGSATDGCQALRQVLALSPQLVLMDIHMPHLNGFQTARYLKERKHPPVVILISSDDSSATKSLAKKAGADGFIVKSASLSLRLTRALQHLFRPNGSRRTAVSGDSFQRPPARRPNQDNGI